MGQRIEGRVRELLEAKNFCHVATINLDGTPNVVPTWVDVEDDLVVLNTAEGRTWPRNLRRDPRVTLTISNLEDPYEYVSIRGRVVEDTHEGADQHIDRMAKKYLGEETFSSPAGEVRIKFKIEPEWVHYYDGG
jgi:PPOX class probable F420-dependent enzyme